MKISLCKVAPTGTSFGALLPQGGAGSLEVGIFIGASTGTPRWALSIAFLVQKKQKQRYVPSAKRYQGGRKHFFWPKILPVWLPVSSNLMHWYRLVPGARYS
jgi:hypothetical protein